MKSAFDSDAVDNHDQITPKSNEIEANKQFEAAATESNENADLGEANKSEEEKPERDQNQDNNQNRDIVESRETKPKEQGSIESEAKLVDKVKKEDCGEEPKKELEEVKENNNEVKDLDEDKR